MILRSFFKVSLAAVLLFMACRKKDNTGNNADPVTSPDQCVQAAGYRNGDTTGNYIVTYNMQQLDVRLLSKARQSEVSAGLLQRNRIDPAVVSASFGGEPGGFVALLTGAEAQRLQSDPSVALVEPDRIISLSTCFTVAAPRLITWNVSRTGYGDGTGKTAWIIDTGIDFGHPDLNVDAGRSRSFISGVASAADENGHGTHVAGIIGAKNNDFGVLGVASGASLVSLRVLDKDGKGLLSSIIQALAWINSHAAAGDVVNMSVGNEDGISPTLDQQVINTAAHGIFIAIAAGNDARPANLYSPGRANGPNVYTVSAIDSLDRFASFSNYGNDVVDYAAPGVRILSTYMGSRYAYMSGTSMAAPHVAGLLLLRGKNIGSSGTAKNDPDGEPDPIAHY